MEALKKNRRTMKLSAPIPDEKWKEQAEEMATAAMKQHQIEEEKKAAVTDFNGKIAEQQAIVDRLAKPVKTHEAEQDVWVFDVPDELKKKMVTFREDTGAEVLSRDMGEDDAQLDIPLAEDGSPLVDPAFADLVVDMLEQAPADEDPDAWRIVCELVVKDSNLTTDALGSALVGHSPKMEFGALLGAAKKVLEAVQAARKKLHGRRLSQSEKKHVADLNAARPGEHVPKTWTNAVLLFVRTHGKISVSELAKELDCNTFTAGEILKDIRTAEAKLQGETKSPEDETKPPESETNDASGETTEQPNPAVGEELTALISRCPEGQPKLQWETAVAFLIQRPDATPDELAETCGCTIARARKLLSAIRGLREQRALEAYERAGETEVPSQAEREAAQKRVEKKRKSRKAA